MGIQYHINPETMDYGRCKAKPGNCRYGTDTTHFSTKAEVVAAREERLAEKHGTVANPLRKPQKAAGQPETQLDTPESIEEVLSPQRAIEQVEEPQEPLDSVQSTQEAVEQPETPSDDQKPIEDDLSRQRAIQRERKRLFEARLRHAASITNKDGMKRIRQIAKNSNDKDEQSRILQMSDDALIAYLEE